MPGVAHVSMCCMKHFVLAGEAKACHIRRDLKISGQRMLGNATNRGRALRSSAHDGFDLRELAVTRGITLVVLPR